MRRVLPWVRAIVVTAAGTALTIGYLRWHSRAVVAAAIEPGSESMESTLDEATSPRLLQVITEARKRLDLPGLQVAVLLRGGGFWTGSAGWADPEQKRPATIRDRYHIGSVSKLYTAASS